MEEALIIFIKNPIAGKVKTRLAASVGDEKALFIYQALLRYTRELCESLILKRYLYYSDFIDRADSWSELRFVKSIQSKTGLGERMLNAFLQVNEKKKVIIGSDCPQLTKEDVKNAFQSLDNYDLVIGPANDGGYYLLGMKQVHRSLFEKMEWSTETVFDETLSRAKEANLKVKVLRELVDLDTLEDLEKTGFKIEEE
ncbi:MAG: TIGR04282 family arsenosugar biosynthesis glycosyltransferase [Vicingaceae bacterium]